MKTKKVLETDKQRHRTSQRRELSREKAGERDRSKNEKEEIEERKEGKENEERKEKEEKETEW